MKTTFIYLVLLGLLGNYNPVNAASEVTTHQSIIVNNDPTTEIFKVYGNCGMCKKTIESSLKKVKGVESAVWNVETKMMTVVFDTDKISLLEIKEKIAGVGYDTDEVKASDEAYNSLHGCCQYERP